MILDFGSQYTWLIARNFRELGFYSQVESFNIPLKKIKEINPAGIILSGGPASVLAPNAPTRDLKELLQIAPLMGICYGLQLICLQWGGKISPTTTPTTTKPTKSTIPIKNPAYGLKVVQWSTKEVFNKQSQKVWMSHGDILSALPKGFKVLAKTDSEVPVALQAKNILTLQFHPEVSHTQEGKQVLNYFAKKMCKVQTGGWKVEDQLSLIKSQVKTQVVCESSVLCALSGGVDSTVMAGLLTKTLGPSRCHCVFVDTGLLRKNEYQEVLKSYQQMGLNVQGISAEQKFLTSLKNITDPEQKRKIIGRLFIDIFKTYKDKHPEIKYLAQGTLYPDVIESAGTKGPGVNIKSHHNVGGLPKNLPFKLIEPFRFLFKDEVRLIGKKLNVPDVFLKRHPFPGPGLAVRICSAVTKEGLQTLKLADAIFIEELKNANLYHQIWQAFAVLLPVRSVGVQGDKRTYKSTIALRAITSTDGMTADWFAFPPDFLHKVSDRITNEIPEINRVVYDITSKPPGSIEWL